MLLLVTLLVSGALAAKPLSAQSTARVRAEENVRREPNGQVLARLSAGTNVDVVERRERWVQVDLEGWVWSRSLQVSDRAGFDLVVTGAQGENLRESPSGDVLGRLERGTLLEELERRPGWIRVRRRAWIWSASLVETETAETTAATTVADAGGPVADWAQSGDRGAAILSSPDGDTLARTVPRAQLAVLAREGSWVRVRLEGWAWLPPSEGTAEPTAEDAAVTPDDLSASPDAFRGRVVTWRLQFISLERAERVRTDFYEGEPFLLTRFQGSDGPFVYVAVPPERLAEVRGLVPLERFTVTARVRTAVSALTGTPIVDLLAIERAREGP